MDIPPLGPTIMECGHLARARRMTAGGAPACVWCANLTEKAFKVMNPQPSLGGRKARCSRCGRETESKLNLRLFCYRAGDGPDEFYCGCEELEEDAR